MSEDEDRLARLGKVEDRQGILEQHVATLVADMQHVKDKVDNGLSRTLGEVWTKLNELVPLVQENAFWVAKWKQAIVYLAVTALGGGAVATLFFLVRK